MSGLLPQDGSVDDTLVQEPGAALSSGELISAASAEASDEPLLTQGERLGRYVILEKLGQGGMGVVYRAYDPNLERPIAIKVTRSSQWSAAARARFQREAQAMAQLQHPHVVAVHDVGEEGEQVYLAMELVEGDSLDQWLCARRRSWQEVLEVYLQAGRGLMAAHAAGIIHRDFKPANVIVDRSGRARILDFGIARPSDYPAEPSDDGKDGVVGPVSEADADASSPGSTLTTGDETTGGSALTSPLTQVGATLGTPAYMAPEQRRGASSTASDQYAFCRALKEGIGGTDKRRRHAHEPARGRPPRALDRILARGLSRAPRRRYASMSALLRELEGLPRVRRRQQLTAGAIFAGAVLVGAGRLLSIWGAPVPCSQLRNEPMGVWGAVDAQKMRAVFKATGNPLADPTADRVIEALNARATQWQAMRFQACEATRVRGEQSEDLMDRRMLCLDRQKEEFRGTVEALTQDIDGAIVEQAVTAVDSLAPLSHCADRDALLARLPMPADPKARARIQEIQSMWADIDGLYKTGQYKRGLASAKQLAADTRATDYAPMIADAEALRGYLLWKAGSHDDAREAMFAATLAASRAGVPAVEANAWVELAWITGYVQERYEQGELLYRVADAAVVRAGEPPRLRASYTRGLGSLYYVRGDYPRAKELFEEALVQGGDQIGPGERAQLLNDLGEVHRRLGDTEQAQRRYEEALAILESRLAPGHPELALYMSNLGAVLTVTDPAAARDVLERALEIRERVLGRDHPKTGYTLLTLASALHRVGELETAFAQTSRVLEIWRASLGEEHPNLAYAHNNLGDLARELGRCGEAIVSYKRAQAMLEKALGKGAVTTAVPIMGQGECALVEKRSADGVRLWSLALAIYESTSGSSLNLARAQFGLARALTAAGRGGGRAKKLVADALATYREAGLSPEIGEIERWQATGSSAE